MRSTPSFLFPILFLVVAPSMGCGMGIPGDTATTSGSPTPDLARRAGGTENDWASGVSSFPDGSFVAVGYFNGTAVFGLGEPGQQILTAVGDSDLYVARYLPNLDLAWARRAGGVGSSYARGVAAVAADGSCIVTGSFANVATFGPGDANETTLMTTGSGDHDIFVARYLADGSLSWARRATGIDNQFANAVATFQDGSSVITGTIHGQTIFGEGDVNETTLPTFGSGDAFLARYNPDGTLAWATIAGGAELDTGQGIAAFGDGSCVVTGTFRDMALFSLNHPILTSVDDVDAFVARYDSNGTLEWAKAIGGANDQIARGVASFADGTCIVTGSFPNTATFEPGTTLTSAGQSDIFVARYQATGALLWAKQAGGTGGDEGFSVAGHADGSFTLAGAFQGIAIVGPGDPSATTLQAQSDDALVARYDPNGVLLWARQATGPDSQSANAVAALPGGYSVVAGQIRDSSTFGPGESREVTHASAGGTDAYVARHGPSGDLD